MSGRSRARWAGGGPGRWISAPWLGVLLVVTAVSLAACDDEKAPPRSQRSEDGVLPGWEKPLTKQAVTAVKRANVAAAQLAGGVKAGKERRSEYLELRRAVAAAAPFFRLRAELGSEVLLGPLRSVDEGGGALAAFDAALRDGDRAQAERQMEQVVRALRLIDNELSLHAVPPEAGVQALSDASYELGLMLLEAYPGVPDGPDAVLADLQGTLQGIESGAEAAASLAIPRDRQAADQALSAVRAIVEPLRTKLSAVKHAHQLSGRAELVRTSGRLGIACRRLGEALGVAVKLPYEARYPTANNGISEPITPLVLPAPRRDTREGDRDAMARLGRRLFFDKRLSRGAKRSCADCHQPAKGYSDGLATPKSFDPNEPLTRNTPTLLYTSLNAAQLWDGRFASAERQALRVIHTDAEMGLSAKELTEAVAADEAYRADFGKAFASGVGPTNIARALVAFEIAELNAGTAPIDRFARSEDDSFSAAMSRGLDVFAGVGRCARCHIPPSFAGSRPRDFAVPVYAVLGVVKEPKSKELDDDEGRAKVSKRSLDRGAFKTPTVRGAALTAPYFHHGAFPTLETVVDFYDDGGGKGLGLDVPNQDPDVRPLKLKPEQKDALLLFMREALADRAASEDDANGHPAEATGKP